MTTEERLARVEQQNKRLRFALMVIVFVAVVGVAMGQGGDDDVPDVIEAKAFHVVTDDGKVLVKLEDSYGLGMGLFGTVTVLNGTTGKNIVTLAMTRNGGGAASTQDSEGRTLVQLGASQAGDGGIWTMNSAGQTLVELGVTTKGDGAVTTMSRAGHELVEIGALDNGEGVVAVLDPSGTRATNRLEPLPR